MRSARSWAALAGGVVVFFLAIWIVIPAPTRALLPLGVGAPEVCAWLATAALAVGALAAIDARRSRMARVALAFAAAALVLAASPLLRFPGTARRFDAAMAAALGPDPLRGVPMEVRAGMRPAPLVAGDLFRGIGESEARIDRGIVFARPGGVPLTVDVYRPLKPGRYPTVIQIYGGAWQRGAPGDNSGFARYLAARGYVVFAIDYRHAPRWRWPAQRDDVRAALAWVRAHAAKYDADASRMALVGRSAGAQLAMVAAYEPEAPPVRGVVSLYGPVDLAEGYRVPPSPDPLGVRGVVVSFIGGTPAQLPAGYREASPISYATRPLPPTLLVYGGRDHIVEPRFGANLHQRLRATGTVSALLVIPWSEHAFDAVPNGLGGQLAAFHVERFLAWALYRS
ncbi:MAG TPA: alpha/beta hydrolase [Longimicrobium sp.]|nr:alpha/beta hydrolase [Longimicrobium sp.]